MENFLLVVLALFLVVLNGFFVAAEFGIVTLRKTRVRAIAKTQGLRGRILGKVHGQLDAYLSACQLGITLASLGLGWVGEPAFASMLEPVFAAVGVDLAAAAARHLLRGRLQRDLLPAHRDRRTGAEVAGDPQSRKRSACGARRRCTRSTGLMYPAIYLLNGSANFVLRVAGLAGKGGHDSHYSNEELKLILRTSQPGEKFTRDERHILAQSLDFSAADGVRPDAAD